MENEKVVVVIPTCDGAEYIEHSIQSVIIPHSGKHQSTGRKTSICGKENANPREERSNSREERTSCII